MTIAVAWAAGVVACGARAELDAPAPYAAHPRCVSASGVRLCGAGCPAIDPPACPGYGCAAPTRYDGTDASAGICWADTPETDYRCDGCQIGDGCLEHAGVWLCVPLDVCEALWDLGVRDVCRYADKSRYDHRPLPQNATGCPAPTHSVQYHACGGDCPPCDPQDRCAGVSPDHPFGLCNGDALQGYEASFSCGTSCPYCAVLDVPSEDFTVAFQYGVCMAAKDACFGFVAEGFPGGLGCYDAYGQPLK